jgi:hypothetical protein
MSQQSSLLEHYAAASQRCRDISRQLGFQRCDEDPTWRAAERQAEHLWKQAREAGIPADDLIAASKLGGTN